MFAVNMHAVERWTLVGALVLGATLLVAGIVGCLLSKQEPFEVWWERHRQTCEQCSGPDGICPEAFDRFRAAVMEELREKGR